MVRKSSTALSIARVCATRESAGAAARRCAAAAGAAGAGGAGRGHSLIARARGRALCESLPVRPLGGGGGAAAERRSRRIRPPDARRGGAWPRVGCARHARRMRSPRCATGAGRRDGGARSLDRLVRPHHQLERAGRLVEHDAGDAHVLGHERRLAHRGHRLQHALARRRDGAGPGAQALVAERVARHAAAAELLDERGGVERRHAAGGVADDQHLGHAEHVDGEAERPHRGRAGMEQRAGRAQQERFAGVEAERRQQQRVEAGVVAADHRQPHGRDRRQRLRLAAAHPAAVAFEDVVDEHRSWQDRPPIIRQAVGESGPRLSSLAGVDARARTSRLRQSRACARRRPAARSPPGPGGRRRDRRGRRRCAARSAAAPARSRSTATRRRGSALSAGAATPRCGDRWRRGSRTTPSRPRARARERVAGAPRRSSRRRSRGSVCATKRSKSRRSRRQRARSASASSGPPRARAGAGSDRGRAAPSPGEPSRSASPQSASRSTASRLQAMPAEKSGS